MPVLAAGLAVLMTAGAGRAALISSTDTISRPGYEIVTFTGGDGTWSVPAGVTSVELLVIGGGGGGMGYGGGGGGGGFFDTGAFSVTPLSSVTVTVGTGGAAAMRPTDTGSYPNGGAAGTGSNSVFDSVIAYGGQGGSVYWTSSGAVNTYGGTSGTNNQDLAGGIVADGPGGYNSGSGVGSKGLIGTSVAGGAGLSSMITGLALNYAGGGGALVNGAGTDGGGNGSATNGTPGFAGAANSGGGGGAGWAAIGGDGGSGVVIVAYAIPEPASGLLLLAGAAGLGLLRRKLRS